MNILLMSDAYHGGGAERAAREMFHALQHRGHRVEMIVSTQSPTLPPGVRGARKPWEKYLRVFDRFSGGLSLDPRHIGSRQILSRLKAGEFDVVHAHNILGNWINLRALQAMATRLPFVWTFHDERPIMLSTPYDLSRVMSREEIFRRTPEPHIARILDGQGPESQRIRRTSCPLMPTPAAIIAPSTYLAAMARAEPRYATVPVHHVPNGLPFMHLPQTQMPRDQARRELGIEPDSKVVFIVAASLNSVYKGMWHAVDALVAASKRRNDLQVVIAGHIAEPLVAKLYEGNRSLRTKMLGFLKNDVDLARAYRAADITLLPSVADNFPYVATESFACETPIVTFRVGGFPDLVGDNERGAMADEMNGESLGVALNGLLSDDAKRIAAGVAARQWVLTTCDVDRWIETHEVIYRSSGRADSAASS